MKKTFRFRAYLNKKTKAKTNNTIELCRQLYNTCLEQRIMVKNLKEKIGLNTKKIDWHFNFNTLAFVI